MNRVLAFTTALAKIWVGGFEVEVAHIEAVLTFA
jgi:hypothetical protein